MVLKRELWPQWLGEELADLPHLKALLGPYPSDDMICSPVSTRVGKVNNNDPSFDRAGCCSMSSLFRPAAIVNLDDRFPGAALCLKRRAR